jgi:predicted DCC family thiol-disulfide oxidoreductase YuxK
MKNKRILNLPEEFESKQPILFFDGECTLCSSSVKFLIRHNPSGNLRFTSLQSGIGSQIVKLSGNAFEKAETLLFLQDNMLFGYSTAALKITAHLSFPWHLLRILFIVPRFIRDVFYKFIAKNRHSWFGRKSFCLTNENEYQNRFL